MSDEKQKAAMEKMKELSDKFVAQQEEFRKITRETLHNATRVIDSDPDAEILIIINRSQGQGMSPLWNFRLPSTLVFVLELFRQLFFKDFIFAEKKTMGTAGTPEEAAAAVEAAEANDKA